MSGHTAEPWVMHPHHDGAYTIKTPGDYDTEPTICSRSIWSHRAEESHANALRIVACVNACAGLTPEQVAAIPRLVAWYTTAYLSEMTPADQIEYHALRAIFPRRPS